MTSRFNIRLTVLILAAAALALPAAASAKDSGTIVLHKSGYVVSTDQHGTQARYDAQNSGNGVFATGGAATPSLSPDRVDKLGSVGGPRVVQVSTTPTGSSQSFNWADAAIGAGIALLVMVTTGAAAAMARGRGRLALPA
jgi:hypothetical protein